MNVSPVSTVQGSLLYGFSCVSSNYQSYKNTQQSQYNARFSIILILLCVFHCVFNIPGSTSPPTLLYFTKTTISISFWICNPILGCYIYIRIHSSYLNRKENIMIISTGICRFYQKCPSNTIISNHCQRPIVIDIECYSM